MKALGRLHGAFGSAHESSAAVGARNPSLYEPKSVRSGSTRAAKPTDGLNRSKVWSPFSAGFCPPWSRIVMFTL
jgi:hypothetical protein